MKTIDEDKVALAQAYTLHDILKNKENHSKIVGGTERPAVEWILIATEILGKISTSLLKNDVREYQQWLTTLAVHSFRWTEIEYLHTLESDENQVNESNNNS